eukprot:3312070-Pyramimonas_sp.AAC.1
MYAHPNLVLCDFSRTETLSVFGSRRKSQPVVGGGVFVNGLSQRRQHHSKVVTRATPDKSTVGTGLHRKTGACVTARSP